METIEEGGAGMVIKFIGDAVMAVFSEPSAAVERSLLIQKRIHEFNLADHEYDQLAVRIGLHMGQVAVEENIQADVFGRHVNRAARIESMASGGQIYMSYTVFDSAKGWLEAHNELVWTLHGAYFLKGIDKPVEIYEVCDPAITQPCPPAKGQRQAAISKTRCQYRPGAGGRCDCRGRGAVRTNRGLADEYRPRRHVPGCRRTSAAGWHTRR